MNTYKLNRDYQEKFISNLLYDSMVLNNIDSKAKLHDEVKSHPLSSAAACMNVLGSMSNKPDELKRFLNSFGLNISKLYPFPSGADIGGLIYNDQGYVVFEWIGPQESPINETGGGRGQNRTSVDAFIIAEIDDKITQLMVEWKFTEGLSREFCLGKICRT